MTNDLPPDNPEQEGVQVSFSSVFRKNIKRLRKRYPRIRQDVQPLIDQLIDSKTPGDQVPGTAHLVFKVRIANRDAQRGKSGGYRIIYYIRTAKRIILLTIYTKSDQSNIGSDEISDLIRDLPDDETN